MEKTKKEILSELYSIKAGLSVISLEKEKLQNEEENVKRSSSDVNKNREDINNAKQNIYNLTQNIEGVKDDFNNLAKQKKLKKKRVGIIEIIIAAVGFGLVEAITGIIVFLKYFFVGLVRGTYKEEGAAFAEKAWPVGRIVGVVVAVGYLMICIVKYWYLNNQSKKAIEENYINNKSEVSETIKTAESLLKQNKEWLVELEGQTPALTEHHKKNVTVYDQVVTVSRESAKIIYNSLVKEYGETLNVREWEHLDLIIYYFETGRADTIKEALQLLDKQIQHEELVETLKQATNSIESSINSIKNEMVVCFGKLAAQIAIRQQETMDRLSQIEDKIDSNAMMVDQSVKMLSYNMSEIASQERMSNALLAKINVGSGQLVNDTNYLLSYAKVNWN